MAAVAAETASTMRSERQAAGAGQRVAAYIIDVIPACVLGLFGLIPVIGPIIVGLVLTPYWLFRDITGGSLGKIVTGIEVMARDGSPAPTGARILRNLPIALGPMLLIIPILGMFIGPPVAALVIIAEGILVLSNGERIGDRIAGTRVVQKVRR
jgi:uncharacterized RDD family membrane protein YckC